MIAPKLRISVRNLVALMFALKLRICSTFGPIKGRSTIRVVANDLRQKWKGQGGTQRKFFSAPSDDLFTIPHGLTLQEV